MKRIQVLRVLLIVSSLFLVVTGDAMAAQPPGKADGPTPKAEATAKPAPRAEATPKVTPKGPQLNVTRTPGKPEFAGRRGFVGKVTTAGNPITLQTNQGDSVRVTLAQDTKCQLANIRDFTCGDIKVNDKVAVSLKKGEGDTLVARNVVVVPGKPLRNHAVGKVTAISAKSITIDEKQGKGKFTFAIDADTKYRFPKDVKAVSVGDLVTVAGKADPITRESVAKIIVVHPTDRLPAPAKATASPTATPTAKATLSPTATP